MYTLIEISLETQTSEIYRFLQNNYFLQPGEDIDRVTRAGEGNMNVVLRIITNKRSFILKQSRPFVQKYPYIPAPLNRIKSEYSFYQAVSNSHIEKHIPEIYFYDPENNLMIFQDLGTAEDMSNLYNKGNLPLPILRTLTEILYKIHTTKCPDKYPKNEELRLLNHQHIFVLPILEDNGFDLDSIQNGLASLAIPFKKNAIIKSKLEILGRKYLSEGDTLLHGDYYPGSWLQDADQIYCIDPEFSFLGFPEFDLGVFLAHLMIISDGNQGLEDILKFYPGTCNTNLVNEIAGTEIMRRLIGLAQLPMQKSLAAKKSLLEIAFNLILHEN